MRDIYSKAASVLILLGKEQDLTKAALDSLQAINAQCKEATNGLADLPRQLFYQCNGYQNTREPSDSPLPSCLNWKAIEAFFSAQWFTRLWVVQEALLTESSVCFCGQYSVRFFDVIWAAKWMIHHHYMRPQYGGRVSRGVKNAVAMWGNLGRRHDLLRLLNMSMWFDVSEPKDKVFAVLGLLPKDVLSAFLSAPEYSGPRYAVLRRADYSVSLSEIYEAATRLCIQTDGNLSFLSYCNLEVNAGSQESDHGTFLTWVPRYDHDHWVGNWSNTEPKSNITRRIPLTLINNKQRQLDPNSHLQPQGFHSQTARCSRRPCIRSRL